MVTYSRVISRIVSGGRVVSYRWATIAVALRKHRVWPALSNAERASVLATLFRGAHLFGNELAESLFMFALEDARRELASREDLCLAERQLANEVASILIERAQEDEAIPFLERATTTRDPGGVHVPAAMMLVTSYFERGDFGRASAHLQALRQVFHRLTSNVRRFVIAAELVIAEQLGTATESEQAREELRLEQRGDVRKVKHDASTLASLRSMVRASLR